MAVIHATQQVLFLFLTTISIIRGLSELDICLPPGSACVYNRDCCGGRESTDTAMTANVHCLTTCCVKTDHFGCTQDSDCCSEGTVCDLLNGGKCTNTVTTDIEMGMAAEAELLNEDDFPINKKGDKTKLIVLIVVSIMMCNVCCFSFHRRNKRIFFISKSQIDRIRQSMDSGDDYDSEHFEYLNEPTRISFVMNARDRCLDKMECKRPEPELSPSLEPGQSEKF